MKPLVLTLTLLLSVVLGAVTPQEDDIVFDDVVEEMTSAVPQVEHRKEHDALRNWRDDPRRLRRVETFWGVPDSSLAVGHVFKQRIPKEAFGGSVDHYEVRGKGGKALPSWIDWDEASSTFLGVPSKKDVGLHRVLTIAHGKHKDVAKESFTITVKPENLDEVKHKDGKNHCHDAQEHTILMVNLNVKYEDLKPTERVQAIENLAGFVGLHTSSVSMHPQTSKEGAQESGGKPRKETHSTSIQWLIGCDGRIWSHQKYVLKQLLKQVRDGTLSEVLQIRVLNLRIKTFEGGLSRNRREAGSGDYKNNDDNEDYEYDDEYDDSYDDGERGDDEENDPITEIPPIGSGNANGPTSKDDESESEHPHRHHHGEGTIGWKPSEDIDEDDIVPKINQRLGSGVNGSSTTPIVRPTISQTPSTSAPSISSSLSPSTTTTIEPLPPITTTTTSTTSTTPPSTTKETSTEKKESQSTSMPDFETPMPTFQNSNTILFPPKITFTLPSTIIPISTPASVQNGFSTSSSVENVTKSNFTEDSALRTNFVDGENESDENSSSTYLFNENATIAASSSTPLTTSMEKTTVVPIVFSTLDASSENVDEKFTPAVLVNVTDDEHEEATEMPTSPNTSVPSTVTFSASTEMPIVMTPSTTTPLPETSPIITSLATESTSTTTTPATTTTSTTLAPTTTTTTTTTTEKPTTTTTTEKIELGVRNFPPRQDRRLKKISVTAGKPLSYKIPADTFSDVEDGDTTKLRLSIYLQGNPVKSTHWLQIDAETQKVYGLPLESDVSKWDHDLVASDSEGLNVTERLDIYVQQHKFSRSVNHEFSVYLRIEKRSAFPNNVDWQLKVVRSLAELYGDSDTSQITVRSVDITQDQAIFTWTNDSVPRNSACPKDEINKLFNVLVPNKDGEPSPLLMNLLGPEIRVKRVVYQGIGQCEEMKRPEVPKVTQEPKTNYPPIPRNQVDHINATVGQLLVYRVPDDTFYDPEDGSAYNMEMALLTNNRTPIPPDNWLQFDVKNREFYGVPLWGDIGRKEYQLIVKDKEGASATDGMVVIVQPPPHMAHSVEFSLTLAIPYESFVHSAMQKKLFIEKLRDLFGDKDTKAISLDNIVEGSTVVTWRNRTLPTSYCPNEEISRLSEVLVKPDKSLTDRVEKVMGDDFPVKQITLTPMGMCSGQSTVVYSPDGFVPPSEDSTAVGKSNDDYLITFVLPAIIIAAMLVLAGIIACVLYRRRRSGKMSVSEQDDERQSFRSKGIPVIFQDELDEKPDPGNKSPVILKEEKPPLPPPEYQKAEDGADVPMLSQENSEEPYQPPPPFATNRDNNRQNRPKPTPTYRKPPPYVPP